MRSALVTVALSLWAITAGAVPAPDALAPTGRWTANARGRAPTPPMGWNSWNAFRTLVDEDKVLGNANALVKTGLARLGYRYVAIDDGWWLRRRPSDGSVEIRTRIFPSADIGGDTTSFRPFTDRLHAMGLKAGIYSDIGYNACSQAFDTASPNLPEGTRAEREVGLADHVGRDIWRYLGDWRFDFIKVDACGIADYGPGSEPVTQRDFRPVPPLIDRASIDRSDVEGVRARYTQVGDAIAAARPDGDYVLSICAWGTADVRAWGKDVGNMVRTSGDIRPTWARMLHNFDSAADRPLYAHPGTWNDPDTLFIGRGEFDADHLTEARAQFTLWAIINAPLFIGYDLRRAPKALIDIWSNAELIRANQDRGGHQGVIAYRSDNVEIIVKTLAATDRKIVALINRGTVPVDATLRPRHLRFRDDTPVTLRDLWSSQTLAPFLHERTFRLASHETRVFEASGQRALAHGMYLSELPGRVNVAVDGVVKAEADPTIHPKAETAGTAVGWPTYGGWGGAQPDRSPWGQPIVVAGVTSDTGVGILGNSRMEVRNGGEFRRFTAHVGVDDGSRNVRSALVFEVFGDGRLLARSKPMRFGNTEALLAADAAGVQVVELVVRQVDDLDHPVSAAWVTAALLW